MKWTDVKSIPFRIKLLTTRKATWVDCNDGTERTIKERWRTVWAIAGIHSHNWWWVNKYGKMSCGCTRNPITRRRILIDMDCPKHGCATWVEFTDAPPDNDDQSW